MATLIFTVTNDLSYDQRMRRICNTLSASGYEVLLVGRQRPRSIPLSAQGFRQKRLKCWFETGPLFYAEFNTRLFFFLLFTRMDVICAIDLDTIIPCYLVSVLRKKRRVYDAHELFTEMKEMITRPMILKFWTLVERSMVPRFRYGYTVNESIAEELHRRYGVRYEVVRNLPVKVKQEPAPEHDARLIIYQGAVNEGRGFETLIPAMRKVNGTLLICGEGNFFLQTQKLIRQHNVSDRVTLKGYVPPDELRSITPRARVAVMIFEATGMNQFHSLSNRFFDYIMAGVPQICVNYPEYKKINDVHQVALMINDTNEDTIANALNRLLCDDELHRTLQRNCILARETLNWENEEHKLRLFYQQLTGSATAIENQPVLNRF